eukprot:CAMPEP_0185160622 /NCGR_PEP_ID=MMETSP1139-20130426/3748_1 /TAXON_ID=298111 /ORGANISM="Pavlova sp., Strain CCMP459" /LENGTH=146 /DNA_ID=CAMNT_0027725833 /DNA_START=106 /DNA_END=542 /DNA_ORIENTATION=-
MPVRRTGSGQKYRVDSCWPMMAADGVPGQARHIHTPRERYKSTGGVEEQLCEDRGSDGHGDIVVQPPAREEFHGRTHEGDEDHTSNGVAGRQREAACGMQPAHEPKGGARSGKKKCEGARSRFVWREGPPVGRAEAAPHDVGHAVT